MQLRVGVSRTARVLERQEDAIPSNPPIKTRRDRRIGSMAPERRGGTASAPSGQVGVMLVPQKFRHQSIAQLRGHRLNGYRFG